MNTFLTLAANTGINWTQTAVSGAIGGVFTVVLYMIIKALKK
jgi:hypothetical protein